MERYLRAIEVELSALPECVEIDTLFFGGGTPTRLTVPEFQRLAGSLFSRVSLAPGYEWSVEANPVDMTPEYAACLQAVGVNRVSLGAQSFGSDQLTFLERDHTADRIGSACEMVRSFAKISLDLIFAVPGQSISDWRRDLREALSLAPQHVSTYGLTIEKGTTFWSRRRRGEFVNMDEECERGMYETAIDTLSQAGFIHYEVSNFALPGAYCRHNENYWLGGNYFALGPSAASHFDGERLTNHRSVFTYLARLEKGESPVAEVEKLTPEERARERLVFGLRRLSGIRKSEFEHAAGFTLQELAGDSLSAFQQQKLLTDDGEYLRLTRGGLMVSDSLWPHLL